jgi:predicted DNA-binding ArsR family transcriptional regulator|tara:strand:+ start:172 stop:372 length:201 start_codon:yes stop_codon:yes gene_type:complete
MSKYQESFEERTMEKHLKAMKSRTKGKKLLEALWNLSGDAARYSVAYHNAYVKVYQHFLMKKRNGE